MLMRSKNLENTNLPKGDVINLIEQAVVVQCKQHDECAPEILMLLLQLEAITQHFTRC